MTETTTRRVPEASFADVGDGLRIHYQEAGSGPAVLFLHGSGPGASGFSNFRHNYPYLAERGFRVIVPDTLGYGHSSKPTDREYDLDFLVGKLEAFVDALGISSCAVVGNSHGGAMAMKLALDRPKLVTKLVLMAPGGLEERAAYEKMRGIQTMWRVFMKEGITIETMRKVFGLQLFDPSLVTEELLEERREIAVLQPKQVLSTMKVPNLAGRLSEIACPVLAYWGMNDEFCPSTGAMRIAESCPDARVVLLTRCGHWVMVEHEAFFNRTTHDFLVG